MCPFNSVGVNDNGGIFSAGTFMKNSIADPDPDPKLTSGRIRIRNLIRNFFSDPQHWWKNNLKTKISRDTVPSYMIALLGTTISKTKQKSYRSLSSPFPFLWWLSFFASSWRVRSHWQHVTRQNHPLSSPHQLLRPPSRAFLVAWPQHLKKHNFLK